MPNSQNKEFGGGLPFPGAIANKLQLLKRRKKSLLVFLQADFLYPY
jgi:hypothetical protein